MIPIGMIESWKQKAPWISNDFVEQDLILSRLLIEMYNNESIRQSLVFKGGTALHKLFLDSALRYSEDLAFDQITAEPIGHLLDTIRAIADNIFEGKASYDRHEQMFILRYRYHAETPPNALMKVKIEINTRNHAGFDKLQSIEHECETSWFNGKTAITTYSLEELLASKLKALYQRNKGRDLFDLKVASELLPNFKQVNQLSRRMFENEGLELNRDDFINNLRSKLANHKFRNDIIPLTTSSTNYNVEDAVQFVIDRYL